MFQKAKNITILFTSDVHGYLLPIDYATNHKTKQGLGVLASAINKRDVASSILIDLGDTIQGSPLMYFHHLHRTVYANPVAVFMNQLDYDYFVPGNHDFNYGKTYLKDFLKQLKAKPLCANIADQQGLLVKHGYDIIEKQGWRILVIGLTTKYIPNWENPRNIKGLIFNDPVIEAKKIVDRFKNQVDLIVVAYHGGLENDLETHETFVEDTGENQGFKLFASIPEIDILLTGHQHRVICEQLSETAVLMPGSNGSHLGVINVTCDASGHKQIKPSLITAEKLVADASLMAQIDDIETANQAFLDEVIGHVPDNNLIIDDPQKARIEKHPIVDFINDVQLEASHAMISATSLANTVTGFKDQITVRNVLSTYVFANTLTVVKIDGLHLKSYLEKCATYFVLEDGLVMVNPRFSYPKLEHYNYDMLDGIDYCFDLTKDFGSRVVSMKYQGKEILSNQVFTLVLNNYRATGGGDFEMLKNLPVIREIPFNVAELMIDYIRKHKTLRIKPKKNIKLITGNKNC